MRSTDPFEAKEIAAMAVVMLADIRAARTLPELDKAVINWRTFADAKQVVPQIRAHFTGAINEVAMTIKAGRA